MHALLKGPEGEISLEHRVACLLDYFCQHPHEPLTKEHLLEIVWAGRVVNEDSLSVAVSKLRKILRDSRGEPQFIKTIPGVGYCWLPETTRTEDRAVESESIRPPAKPQRLQRRQSHRLGLVVLAIIIIALLTFAFYRAFSAPTPSAQAAKVTDARIDTRDLSEAQRQAFEKAQHIVETAVYHEVTTEDYKEAIGIYRAILDAHPNFTPAHVGIAEAKFEMSAVNGYQNVQLYRDEIKTITDLALTQQPMYGDALELKAKLAFVAEWDLDTAETLYGKAIEAMPNDSGIYLGFSELLITRGKIAEAKELLRQLRKKNPNFYRYINLSLVYMFQGDYDKAIAETQRLMNSEAPSLSHNAILHRIGVVTGDDAMALEHLKVLMHEQGYSDAQIARYQAIANKDGIKGLFSVLLEERNEDNLGQYIPPLSWARYAATAGENEQALFYLSRAVQAKQPQALLVHEDPHFDPIRQLPEFQALLAQIPH